MFLRYFFQARWFVLLAVTITICLVCVIFLATFFGQSESRLELTHNAGYVRAGEVVKHDFPIVNKSRKPIKILDIKASCACNLPKEIVRTIDPKESCNLPMNIKTEGRSGPTSATALVKLGDGREIHCVLNCNVVTVYPNELLFSNIMKSEEIKEEFYLRNIAEQKININNIKYSQDYFDIEWNEHAMKNENISSHKITVSLKNNLPYGPFDKWITIETDDTFDPDKRVNIRGYVRQPIECDKTRVAMGVIKGNSRKTEKVKIFSPYDKPFKIVKVEHVKGDHCNLHLEKIDETNYELEITINRKGDETQAIISEEISIYGIVDNTQVRQDVLVFAMLEI